MSRILEIIGPPGSGKSTLARGLLENETGMVAGQRIRLKQPGHWAALVRYAAVAAPRFAGVVRNGRRLTWQQTKSLFVLHRWQTVLSLQGASTSDVIVIDQGPIFRLASIHGFGPSGLRDSRYQSWWSEMYELWAGQLDTIIWLDADDDTLLNRIYCRPRWHEIMADEENAQVYLDTYRASYQHVVSQIASRRPVEILRLQTAGVTPAEIFQQVIRTSSHRNMDWRVE